ncbi:glycosyltransferase family 2 protein [Iodobacter fluviatilis]|uniref:Glycosyl transferase family 2 n=1 Tax=Iodobacter fluviatilis TaxID=537 RepID=A0A377Q531_9NEIS|nr:glycosyltransferase [Iodobacter fluviatilis]TCU81503.1 glycosyl transferase family 2 [Iodobacter fluviatilis]STQ89927.1 Hyaluronan synthase [Iodobacter fluviatilis]
MTSFEPKISIVINNYNYEKYIGVAIQSALDQTYENVEIIVVDDGSTDGSIEIIKGYSNIKAIFKKNGGQVSAINEGFSIATGELIIFLDSDDYLFANACCEVVRKYTKAHSMISYKLQLCNEQGFLRDEFLPSIDLLESNHLDFIIKYGYFQTAPMSGAAYSAKFLANHLPFDTSRCGWIDHLLTFTAPIYGEISSVNYALGAYRIGHSSLSEHAKISLNKLRKNLLASDLYAEKISESLASEKNILIKKNKILGPYHWKERYISFVVDNENHPFVDDSRLMLAYNCIVKFMLWPQIGFTKKIKNILQISTMVVLSREKIILAVGKMTNINLKA